MPPTRVADLTVDEFKDLIRETVKQTIVEMVSDPDEGLQLRRVARRQREGTKNNPRQESRPTTKP